MNTHTKITGLHDFASDKVVRFLLIADEGNELKLIEAGCLTVNQISGNIHSASAKASSLPKIAELSIVHVIEGARDLYI